MSNLYQLKHGSLEMSPLRAFANVPLIKLGDSDFKKVKDFLSRFENIPDILELDHLTVSGDVRFGNNVVLRVSGGPNRGHLLSFLRTWSYATIAAASSAHRHSPSTGYGHHYCAGKRPD
jgi:UDP-N-acetylglucosamine pyrophosphorylase